MKIIISYIKLLITYVCFIQKEDYVLLIYLNLIETPEDKNKFTLLYEEYKEKMFYTANRILNKIRESARRIKKLTKRENRNSD